MRFLLSVFLISFLIFFFGCKTTRVEQSTISSSSIKSNEEPEEEIEDEKPQTIIVPTGSLGNISEVKKKMLEKTLESALDDHFAIVPKDLFEEAQEKAFEELDYEECTEEQCIMMIKEILQVENAFQLVLMEEEGDTQISLTWNDLDQKRVEEDFCEGCKTKQLRKSVTGLVKKMIGVKEEIVVKEEPPKKVEPVVVETPKVVPKVVEEPVVQKIEKDIIITTKQKTNSLYLTFINGQRTWVKENTDDSIGKYEGDSENNLPHGYGILTYFDGGFYKGNWLNGLMYGKGERFYFDGSKDIGIWKMNKPSNTKRLKIDEYSSEKWLYLNYVNGIKKWSSERNAESTGIFRGYTLNNLPINDGTLNYFNGSMYSGGFKKGEHDGWGIYLFKNKDTLVGKFKDGDFNQGLEYSFNEGEFSKLNITKSFGLIRLNNGDEFNGHLSNTKPDGFGVMEYKNGEKYIGMWSNNEFSGYGIFFKKDNILIGKWEKNSKYLIEEYDYNGNLNNAWVKNKRLLNLPKIPK